MIYTPVLHVVGRTDVVVARERSNLFMGFSKNKRVEEHVGGTFLIPPSHIPARPSKASHATD